MANRAIKPVTVRIEDFRKSRNQAVADSELPAYMLEILIGQYLEGLSIVAKKEYAQEREEWELTQKESAQDG